MKLKSAAPSIFLLLLIVITLNTSTPVPTSSATSAPAQGTQLPAPKQTTTETTIPADASTQQPEAVIIPTKIVSGKTEIPLCATLPLSGESAIFGKDVADGMSLFFNKQRQAKTKSTILSKLYTKDNQSTISALQNDVADLQKQSSIFISLTGGNVLAALAQKIDANDILGMFPIDGTTTYRAAKYKNLIFFRPSHEAEIDALIKYTTQELNKNKIALFYESSEWGEDCRAALKKILPKYNATLVSESFYPQNSLNITKAAQEIAASAQNAILCIAQARAAYNFIQTIINKGLAKTTFLCLSRLIPIQKTLREERGVDIITTSVVPDPVKNNFPITKEFRGDLQKFLPNKKPSAFLFEGYINAALTAEILKLVQPPFTIERIRTAIEEIGTVKFKGLSLSFDRKTRTFSRNVWINNGKETEWFLSQNYPPKKKITKKRNLRAEKQ